MRFRVKCDRVVSHVWRTGLDGHLNWSWSQVNFKQLQSWVSPENGTNDEEKVEEVETSEFS